MKNYFKTVVKFDKINDAGVLQTITEQYIVNALSFIEAEAIITEEMQPFISGDFLVHSIKREKIAEVFDCENLEAYKWYACKVNFITLDEVKGVEKKVPSIMYIKASSVQAADEGLKIELKNTISDYEIEQIKETKVIEIYEYK